MLSDVTNILLWLACGGTVALTGLLFYVKRSQWRRLVVRSTAITLLVVLVGTARIERITEINSVRGILGAVAIVLVLIDLFMQIRSVHPAEA